MSGLITEKDVELIIEQVLSKLEPVLESKKLTPLGKIQEVQPESSNLNRNLKGIFDSVEAAVEAAYDAQVELVTNYRVEDRDRMIQAIRNEAASNAKKLAFLIYEETKLGRAEDKIAKIGLAAAKTPGTEELRTKAVSGDYGLMIEEMAPFGVIGGITPITNPVETIINNTISMLAGGNSVVFNVHPSSKKCSAFAVDLINHAIIKAKGPENLVTMISNPTIETVNELAVHPKISMLVGTGGPSLVKALLRSGKKTIGAGAGNPPVVVDETADLELAAKSIIEGASFDNNILCIGEKEVFVVATAADDLLYHMLQNGAYILSKDELDKVMKLTLAEEGEVHGAKSCSEGYRKKYLPHKDWIGKDASKILNAIGVNKPGVKLILCEVDSYHPYVVLEQMMPILPIVRCQDIHEAIRLAVKAEGGNRHTASIFSRNVDHMTKFAKAINTTIFVIHSIPPFDEGFLSILR